ncbi:MAG: ABC transporter substrate-binding protein [Rhodovibrionaceae bacterium]
MERQTLIKAGALAASLICGAAGAAGALAADNVKIGGSFGLTGGLAPYSPSLVDAARMAEQEINENGGILDGRMLELLVADDQTNPQAAVDAAQKLISVDNISAMIGPFGSAQVLAVANNVSVPNGVPQLAPTATSPKLTDLEDDDFIFRVVASDAYIGKVLADVVLERGLKTVSLMFLNNDYGVGLAETFRSTFTANGGTLAGDIAFEPNKASYRGELATIATGGAEALVLISYPADGGTTILRQALENAFFETFVLTDGMKEQAVLDEIGVENLAGSFGVAPEAPPETNAVQNFNAAYGAYSEHEVDSLFIRETYDATMILALAIEKAGSTDRTAIRDALREVANPPGETILPGEWAKAKELIAAGSDIDYQGAAGPHDFDEVGDVDGTVGVFEITADGFATVKVIGP